MQDASARDSLALVEYQAEKTNFIDRMRSFLAKQRGGSERAETSAPLQRKVHRLKSYEWLLSTDNAIKVLAHNTKGYEQYRISDDMAKNTSGFEWPLLLPCVDMGSDRVCPLNFLRQSLQVNVCPVFDFNRSAWNDIKRSLRSGNLWYHMLCMVLAWNHGHGSFHDSVRFHQVKDVVEVVLQCVDFSEDQVFLELLPLMLADGDQQDRAADPAAAAEVHHDLAACSVWWNVGSKISMCRFMGAVRRSEEEDKLWHKRLYGLTHAAIALGFEPPKEARGMLPAVRTGWQTSRPPTHRRKACSRRRRGTSQPSGLRRKTPCTWHFSPSLTARTSSASESCTQCRSRHRSGKA